MSLETDPIDWELDADGDIIVPIRYIRGLPAVAQGIRVRLLMFKGEWFLDETLGIQYYDSKEGAGDGLLGNAFNPVRAEAYMRKAILAVPNVVSIASVTATFDNDTRKLSMIWRVITAFGESTGEVIV